MEASQQRRNVVQSQEKTQGTRVPRRLLRQAMARCHAGGRPSVVSVSSLDTMRWRIRLTPKDGACNKEIFISPGDGGLLYVTTENDATHITLYGDLGEACLQNLGDCFVNALCDKARRIDIWFGATSRIAAAARSLFESLGRHIVRQNMQVEVTIHGPEQATGKLTEAFAQGSTRAKQSRVSA